MLKLFAAEPISTRAPFGIAAVTSSKAASIVMSPNATPYTRIGFIELKTIPSGKVSREQISWGIQATPPLVRTNSNAGKVLA